MATPEDSHVLRQLIDQIDGELFAFNTVGAGSDQSLASFTTSQDSLAASDQTDSRHGSSLSLESQGYQDQHAHQLHYPTLQQQTKQHVASATSAIFGSSFDRSIQRQHQHSPLPPTATATTTIHGSTSLVMNGSYYMGPRAPQYIPSPLASPISPDLPTALPGLEHEGEIVIDSGKMSRQSTSSQGSLLAISEDIAQDLIQQQQPSPSYTSEVIYESEDTSTVEEETGNDQIEPLEQKFDDQIKVDVTELYNNFGQPSSTTAKSNDTLSSVGGMAKVDTRVPDSLLTLKLPELSFSSNDLSSLLDSGPGGIEGEGDKRTRSNTFHGTVLDIAELTQDNSINDASSPSPSVQLIGPSPAMPPANSLKYPAAFPPRQSSPLKVGYFSPNDSTRDLNRADTTTANNEQDLQPGGPQDNLSHLHDLTHTERKRLSLVTSGMGLAAASAAAASRTQMDNAQGGTAIGSESGFGKSLLDLPSWDLAPLSPPVDVGETMASTTTSSITISPMDARRGSLGSKSQDSPGANSPSANDIFSSASATSMTPTTPLTTREARILAGREALLRTMPDKQRLQRGISVSSASSSIASSSEKSTAASQEMDARDTARSTATKSRQSLRSVQSYSSEGGVFGAVPGRGQLADIPPEKLVFPDLSLKPIPLKAYRVRKMTLQERNTAYSLACAEFTRARSGLDVWALRSMMQDRPALMKDPPAIVKAIVGKQVQGQGDTLASKLSMASGRMTPSALHAGSAQTSSISSGHGLGARIKNAGKRLSMDISSGMAPTPEPHHPSGTGSLFYKQKSAKSAVELGAWSPGLARNLPNPSAVAVNSAIPPVPQGVNSHKNFSSASLQPRTGLIPSPSSGGSTFLSHQKRNSIAVVGQGNPLSNSLRSRAMSDLQAGSRMSIVGKDSPVYRTNSGSSSESQNQQQQGSDLVTSPLSYRSEGPLALISPTTTLSPPIATSSAFMERPIKRSLSSHYTRRPASMMIVPNAGQTSGARPVLRSTSIGSYGSLSSSSLRSMSSNTLSMSDSSKSTGDLNTSSTTSSLTAGLKQQQQDLAMSENTRPAYAYQSDGTAIPYADETKSKDEVYSPLTSPIMIPIGGFSVVRPSVQTNNHQANEGWSSPLSTGGGGGGLSRPLTYAGPSSAGHGSSSSLVTSPATVARKQQQSQQHQHWQQQQQQQQQRQQSFAQGYLSPTTPGRGMVEPMKEKTEKSHRYSSASFSSLASFAKNQKRSSKKDRKKELQQEQAQLEQQQQEQQKRTLDQRYSVAVVPLSQSPSHNNDYLTEQSLDKLSDVLPHVDRDRLSIYLQRAYGDEMVAIGLAMSDLRSGLL